MLSYHSRSREDTFALGERLGQKLADGTFIALDGDLGAGKTVFVKGLAKGLGISEEILSPTFTLLRQYAGRLKLNHYDVYRIEDEDELLETGYEDVVGGGVTVVEWAHRIPGLLPENRISVTIERIDGEGERFLNFAFPKEYETLVKAAVKP